MNDSASDNPDPLPGDNSSEETSAPDQGSTSDLPGHGPFEFKPLKLSEYPQIKAFEPQQESTAQAGEIRELAEEIADDMLRLIERMKRIEARQDSLVEQLGMVQQFLQDNKRQSLLALDALREELLGERKAFTARSTFNAILPTLDSLRVMHSGLADTPENQQIRAQLYAVSSSLSNVIQSLGFVEFQIQVGVPFDPEEMESLGFAEGEPNEVVRVVRSGYKVGNVIVRPCGVLLAQPPSTHQS